MNMFSLSHLFSGFSFKMHSFHCQFTVYEVNYCICGNKLYDVFPGLLKTELLLCNEHISPFVVIVQTKR